MSWESILTNPSLLFWNLDTMNQEAWNIEISNPEGCSNRLMFDLFIQHTEI